MRKEPEHGWAPDLSTGSDELEPFVGTLRIIDALFCCSTVAFRFADS